MYSKLIQLDIFLFKKSKILFSTIFFIILIFIVNFTLGDFFRESLLGISWTMDDATHIGVSNNFCDHLTFSAGWT